MKNHLGDSDDNNFEIKNYKFNPQFKNKTKNQINENIDRNKIIKKYNEYIPNKKNYENAIPSMTNTK